MLTGVDFDVAAGQVVCLLGPNGAGKTTTIEILEGFRIRSAGEVSVLGQDPAHADEDWRARTGVVLQSWRDHPRWTPRKLLTQLGGYFEPYSTPERRRPHDIDRAPGDGGVDRPRGPQDRHPVGWAAATARRRGRDRRAPRAAVPRRAHGRLRPPGAPPVPWVGPQRSPTPRKPRSCSRHTTSTRRRSSPTGCSCWRPGGSSPTTRSTVCRGGSRAETQVRWTTVRRAPQRVGARCDGVRAGPVRGARRRGAGPRGASGQPRGRVS